MEITAIQEADVPTEPDWMIWGSSYTPPSTALFCLNFLGRNWFDLDAKLPPARRLTQADKLTFVRLMITLYAVQKQGLLLSKKDVMRAIDAEHISTAKRYTDLGVTLGFVTTRKAKLDTRIQLLYLTEAGQRAVERELEVLTKAARWLVADLSENLADHSKSYELRDSITVEPPKLEQLAIVNDELRKPPPGTVPPMRGRALASEGAREAWLKAFVQARQRYRPLTALRWVAAYSEILEFDPRNREALDAREQNNERLLGNLNAALEDADKLVEIDFELSGTPGQCASGTWEQRPGYRRHR